MQEIRYKCTCLKNERAVWVQHRERGQNVVTWMEVFVKTAIGADHSAASPRCHAKVMEYAKIYMPDGTEYIGQAVKKYDG